MTQTVSKPNQSNTTAVVLLVCLCLGITTLAYQSVLFDFFAGDDFVHLIWLRDAVKNYELIWRNFHSSWLDGTTTKFYRPLISVFMVSDYVLFNRSGLGFHITNLIFHLLSVLSIFFITSHLTQETMRLAKSADGAKPEGLRLDDSFARLVFPAFAALMFGLYPLHCEAVSWITGRVDAVVTAFITLSLWCYLSNRQKRSWLKLIACYGFLILGLLSKEMAITLPAVFALIELFFPLRLSARGLSRAAILRRIVDAARQTFGFFVLIALYFGVRYLALGTLVGGYDDSLFFISDPLGFIRGWLAGLRILFEPFNRELVSVRSLPVKLWDISLVFAVLVALINAACYRPLFRLYLFLTGWFVLSLAPVYKVFAISDDLQGSRLAHLATVPLALLLTAAVINLSSGKVKGASRALRTAFGTIFCACAFYFLVQNNAAWVGAGTQSNQIRHGLSELYKSIEGDPQVLFVGLPDQEHGAYICRNALSGMTHTPQLERDIANCVLVDRFEPIFPFAHIKQSLYQDQDKVKIYRWDKALARFMPVDLSQVKAYPQTETITYGGASLRAIAEPQKTPAVSCKYTWQDDGGLAIEGHEGKGGRPEIKLNINGQPCFSTEFVAVTLKISDPGNAKEGIDLLYSNDLVPDFELKSRTHAHLNVSDLPAVGRDITTTIVLPLRSLPEWTLGGQSHGFLLKLPHDVKATLQKVEIVPQAQLAPQLTFDNSGYLGTKGYYHVNKKGPDAELTYDVSQIPQASGVMTEITRANLLFEEQCSTELSKVVDDKSRRIVNGQSGTVTLPAADFKSQGIYQVRLWAVDSKGNRLGQSSDHIVIVSDG